MRDYHVQRNPCWEMAMSELIFVVEEAPEGGYIARALGQSIFTEADTLTELPGNVREEVIAV